MDIDKLDPKHKALLALVAAADAFFDASNAALEEKFPGTNRGAQNRALLDEGKAHLAISIQAGSGQVKAALALVVPEFVKTLEAPEMELNGSIASIFSDPDKVKVIDLAKMN